ncbi:MAG: GTP 3',8-cyclase MoaA [Syntrophales bacterium]
MVDKYNRNINYLRVSVTDRCNLRCIYCMPTEGISCLRHEDILTYEELHRIIRVASDVGICKVRITGGEPLVRRGIVDFVKSLGTINKLSDISMTTNGILLKEFAAELFHAGIGRINISLDSLNAEKYRKITRLGNLQTVLDGIEKARQVGFSPIKINIVAIKGFNDDEILDFARLTIDNPLQIRFIELMPLGDAGIESDGRFLSNDLIKERIATIGKLEQVKRQGDEADGPADMYRLAGSKGHIGLISAISHNFCSSCNRLRLTSDGQLRSCLLSDKETDLRGPLRSGCSDSGLKDIIEGAIAKKPDRHKIANDGNYRKKCVKEMSTIGG